jgi:endonuclease-3
MSPHESKAALTTRAIAIDTKLSQMFPEAKCELDYENPLQLLVATVLSAQCTDKRVNMVTPVLFKKYPKVADLAAAPIEDIEAIIRSTGFYHNKAMSIKGLSAAIIERFAGEVPNTLEELVTLPGAGRKTANVVLGNAFGVPGVTVDTHVGRIARRLGWTKNTDPVKVEFDIMAILPSEYWTMLNHRLIFLGRRVCHSRKPACGACELAGMCPSFGEGPTDPTDAAKLVKTGD